MSALQFSRLLFPNKKFTFCDIVPFPTVIGRVESCVFGSLGMLMIVSILVVLEAITKHCAVTCSVAEGTIPPEEGGVPRHEIRHTDLQIKGPATDLSIRVFLIFLAVLPCAICKGSLCFHWGEILPHACHSWKLIPRRPCSSHLWWRCRGRAPRCGCIVRILRDSTDRLDAYSIDC